MKTWRDDRTAIGSKVLAALSLLALGVSLSGCLVYPARGGYYRPAVVAAPVVAVRPPVVVVR
jgi:hypothetical protein